MRNHEVEGKTEIEALQQRQRAIAAMRRRLEILPGASKGKEREAGRDWRKIFRVRIMAVAKAIPEQSTYIGIS